MMTKLVSPISRFPHAQDITGLGFSGLPVPPGFISMQMTGSPRLLSSVQTHVDVAPASSAGVDRAHHRVGFAIPRSHDPGLWMAFVRLPRRGGL